jgi:hypothetical protein
LRVEARHTTRENLLPRVWHILERIGDEEDRAALEQFFNLAALTIEELGLLDVDRLAYLLSSSGTYHQAYAIVDALLGRVQSIVVYIEAAFPSEHDEKEINFDFELTDNLRHDLGEVKTIQNTALSENLNSLAWSVGRGLIQIKSVLESAVQSGDMTHFLLQLDDFRGRTKAGIGEMFYSAVLAHAVARRPDVVPFYQEDVDAGLALRREITVFRSRLGIKQRQLHLDCQNRDAYAALDGLRNLVAELDGFIQSPHFASLHAPDRGISHHLRRQLGELMQMRPLEPGSIVSSVEGLVKFVESLNLVNQRDLLLSHDRESIVSTRQYLELAEGSLARNDLSKAQKSLVRAVEAVSTLFGRDPTFDGLLKLLQHVNVGVLGVDDILALTGLIRCHAVME